MEPRCSLSPARVSDEKPWQFRHSDPLGAPGHHPLQGQRPTRSHDTGSAAMSAK